MSTDTLLLELGTEELPPGSLTALSAALAENVCRGLAEAHLEHGEARVFATPRRLALLLENVALRAADQAVEVFGPPADRARQDDGSWSAAAAGFARKHGVAPEDLAIADTDKGPRLVFRTEAPGQDLADAVRDLLPGAVRELPMPKRMRWGASREEFLRPAHWLVALIGESVIDCSVLGLQADRITYGHRFHAPEPLSLDRAQDYEARLREAHVIADADDRRATIRQQVETEAARLNATAVIDADLLEEVTALVEWPVVLTGGFEKRFLDVPQEALISSMTEHQKYFHVVDDAGALLPHFIFVSNLASRDPAQVVDGNERVIRPRLADAMFFFDSDKQTPLEARVADLASIVFQEKLGTLLDKTERVAALAEALASQVGADPELAGRAARLSKADLNTLMVGEFPDLQGIAGRYYATYAGEDAEVASALEQQYLPAFAGDRLPEGPVATALALADRLDTLVGIFGIGQSPTGSRDPFALRRAALGVLRILIDKELTLDLRPCLETAVAGFPADVLEAETADSVLQYILDRLRAWYEDAGISAEVFMAVNARHLTIPLDIDRRIKAVQTFSALPEATSLAAANKRVSNILQKQGPKNLITEVSDDLLTEPAECALAQALASSRPVFEDHMAKGLYAEALSALAVLQGPVDRFFEDVMVMVEDDALRQNRLALLSSLRDQFLQVADISCLVPAK